VRGQRHDLFRARQSSLDPWLVRLEAEWTGGCHVGAELWRRLRASGFAGSLRVVGEWATRRRRDDRIGQPFQCWLTPSFSPSAAILMKTSSGCQRSDGRGRRCRIRAA
jgi:hypothetical protein